MICFCAFICFSFFFDIRHRIFLSDSSRKNDFTTVWNPTNVYEIGNGIVIKDSILNCFSVMEASLIMYQTGRRNLCRTSPYGS